MEKREEGCKILRELFKRIVSHKLPVKDITYSMGIFSIRFEKGLHPSKPEWCLFVYMTGWRLERKGLVLLGCDDEKGEDDIKSHLSLMKKKKLVDFSILNPWFDLFLCFEDHINLRTFSVVAKPGCGNPWTLFTPDNKYFLIDHGGKWSFEEKT